MRDIRYRNLMNLQQKNGQKVKRHFRCINFSNSTMVKLPKTECRRFLLYQVSIHSKIDIAACSL